MDDRRRKQLEYHAYLDAQVRERQEKDAASRQGRRQGPQGHGPGHLPQLPPAQPGFGFKPRPRSKEVQGPPGGGGKENDPSVDDQAFGGGAKSPAGGAFAVGGGIIGGGDLASTVARLIEEVAHQAAAVQRLHQRDVEGQSRLRAVEGALAEATAGREAAELRARLAGEPSEAVAVLRAELERERGARAADAGRLLEAFEASKTEVQRTVRLAEERAVVAEDALRRERVVAAAAGDRLRTRIEGLEQQHGALRAAVGEGRAEAAKVPDMLMTAVDTALGREAAARSAALAELAASAEAGRSAVRAELAGQLRGAVSEAVERSSSRLAEALAAARLEHAARLSDGLEAAKADGVARAKAVERAMDKRLRQELEAARQAQAVGRREVELRGEEVREVLSAEIRARQGGAKALAAAVTRAEAAAGRAEAAAHEALAKLDGVGIAAKSGTAAAGAGKIATAVLGASGVVEGSTPASHGGWFSSSKRHAPAEADNRPLARTLGGGGGSDGDGGGSGGGDVAAATAEVNATRQVGLSPRRPASRSAAAVAAESRLEALAAELLARVAKLEEALGARGRFDGHLNGHLNGYDATPPHAVPLDEHADAPSPVEMAAEEPVAAKLKKGGLFSMRRRSKEGYKPASDAALTSGADAASADPLTEAQGVEGAAVAAQSTAAAAEATGATGATGDGAPADAAKPASAAWGKAAAAEKVAAEQAAARTTLAAAAFERELRAQGAATKRLEAEVARVGELATELASGVRGEAAASVAAVRKDAASRADRLDAALATEAGKVSGGKG